MVKLDVSQLKFMEDEDFRVLTALEMALRNHDVAPTVLIERIAGLSHGGARRRLNHMLKNKLIHHESRPYDGFAMKYAAYDLMAMRTFSKRGSVLGVASRIGCGKESDIILVQDENGAEAVMKLQRLGRCSFRTVSRNRDYKGGFKKRRGEGWFYLSRLAAQKEFAFMKLLHDEGFPVPKPIDQNRHAVVMEFVEGTLLNHIEKLEQPQKVYERCLALIVKLAQSGLVHGDFNEFNLFVNKNHEVVMIDFPQMVSIDHPNAAELFERDINNLALFFDRRFGLTTKYFPKLETDVDRQSDLDRRITELASGAVSKQQLKDLDLYRAQLDEEEEEEGEEEEEEEEAEEEVEDEEEEDENAGKEEEENVNVVGEEDKEAGKAEDGKQKQEQQQADENPTDKSKQPLDQKVVVVTAEEQDKQQQRTTEDKSSVATTTTTSGSNKFVSLAALSKGSDFPEETMQSVATAASSGAGCGDDDDDGRRSVALSTATTAVPRPLLSAEEIKARVRRQLNQKDEVTFRRNMHRNCQKGKEKLRVKRQIHGVSGVDSSGVW